MTTASRSLHFKFVCFSVFIYLFDFSCGTWIFTYGMWDLVP